MSHIYCIRDNSKVTSWNDLRVTFKQNLALSDHTIVTLWVAPVKELAYFFKVPRKNMDSLMHAFTIHSLGSLLNISPLQGIYALLSTIFISVRLCSLTERIPSSDSIRDLICQLILWCLVSSVFRPRLTPQILAACILHHFLKLLLCACTVNTIYVNKWTNIARLQETGWFTATYFTSRPGREHAMSSWKPEYVRKFIGSSASNSTLWRHG